MITQYWLEKGISTLLFFIFIFLGYLSFGYPQYFDRLFLVFLLCLTALYKRNQNIASIAFIVLLVRLVSEFILLYQGPYEELFGYVASFVIIYKFKFKFDKQISFLLLPLLVIGLTSEIYWYFTGYEGPKLGFYVVSIAVNCWLRYLLMYRAHITRRAPSIELSGISLDYDLYRLIGAANIIISAMIIEYLVRHWTPLEPLLVYQVYTYGLQLVTILFPYLVIAYIIKSKFILEA